MLLNGSCPLANQGHKNIKPTATLQQYVSIMATQSKKYDWRHWDKGHVKLFFLPQILLCPEKLF